MDVGAVLIQLKVAVMDDVVAWQNQLNRRKHEAIETLQAEGVHVESRFHVELDGLDYLIAYTRADDIAKAHEISRKSQFAIDQVHQQFKRTWQKVIPASLLVDLQDQK
jgi:Rps23 Pro-64 3,4-dihydroxylase Tpa1-like proline 4-hydroxylase